MKPDPRMVESCLRVAAKKEALRLKPKLIELAKAEGLSLTKTDYEQLEIAIFERMRSKHLEGANCGG